MMMFSWVLALSRLVCLHGAKTEKNIIILTVVKTSNLKQNTTRCFQDYETTIFTTRTL